MKMKARYLRWVMAAVAGILTADAQASELLGLLEVLRDNGTITQAQYERLRDEAIQGSGQAGAQSTQLAADKAPVEPVATVPTADLKPEVESKFGKTGGLTWKDRKRGYELELGGRLLLDAVNYRDDLEPLGSGTELRAARVSLKGSLAEDWKFKAQYDFAENDLSVKDVYLRYQGLRRLDALTIGQFKEPFSLEEQTSSKHITFMERALPVDTFSPGRALGLGIDAHGKSWNLSAGLFAEAVGDVPADEGNEGWGMAVRGTWALIRGDRRSLHLGAALENREPDDDGEVRYRAGPESHLTSVYLVNTGKIDEVENTRTLGLEAALVEGPFSLQGEYIRASVERDGGMPELDFNGWYIFGSWFLTGESRPYSASDGAFDRVIPRGEWGAWELALRYSTLDLDDRDVLGGEANSTTLGLNWYINPRIRIMANYIRVESEREGVSDDPDVFQLRSQLVF
ncbi:MAG: OprO/OprP family phosphate-selective porin [Gammaproteobacteria bacterium]|nr:OprO/OprP family phosphate-selective porin [Gammaproteobacteria bacterium]